MANARWTVEPGRELYFDGRPAFGLTGDYATTGIPPVAADAATKLIAELFNRNGVTPDSLYKKQMGRPPRRRTRETREAREWDRKHSMTYGQLPPFEQFEHDVRTRIDPESSPPRPYWPEGTAYPMELVSAHEIELAETFGLTEFETERQRNRTNTRVRGFRETDPRVIYEFVEFLADRWANGDEEAGDLASSIMYVLGYEWI